MYCVIPKIFCIDQSLDIAYRIDSTNIFATSPFSFTLLINCPILVYSTPLGISCSINITNLLTISPFNFCNNDIDFSTKFVHIIHGGC